MALPVQLIDLAKIDNVDVSGRGGKESQISALLPSWTRANAPLYDYETEHCGTKFKLEIKKQANLQWFDSGKYYKLDKQNRAIYVLFINHIQGQINSIATVRLGTFVDLLMCEPKYQAQVWTDEVMKVAADFKIKYPSLQFKAKVEAVTMLKKHPDIFQVLYTA